MKCRGAKYFKPTFLFFLGCFLCFHRFLMSLIQFTSIITTEVILFLIKRIISSNAIIHHKAIYIYRFVGFLMGCNFSTLCIWQEGQARCAWWTLAKLEYCKPSSKLRCDHRLAIQYAVRRHWELASPKVQGWDCYLQSCSQASSRLASATFCKLFMCMKFHDPCMLMQMFTQSLCGCAGSSLFQEMLFFLSAQTDMVLYDQSYKLCKECCDVEWDKYKAPCTALKCCPAISREKKSS